MPDDLSDDLLGPLRAGPVPPLAAGDRVRARGEQRARRTRALLAGTGALVVLAAGGTAYGLTGGGGGDDALRFAATAPPVTTAAPTTSPSTAPVCVAGGPSTDPTCRGGSAVTTPAPSAGAGTTSPGPGSPTTPPSTAPPAPPVAIPAEALVSAAELGTFSWVRWASSRSPVEAGVDPCGTGLVGLESAVAHLSGSYQIEEAGEPVPETPSVGQQVVRFPSAAAAAAAAAGYRADVARCSVLQRRDGSTEELRVVSTSPYVVDLTYTSPDGNRNPFFLNYTGVAVAGDLVSTWTAASAHGYAREDAERVATSVQAALCRVSDAC